MKLSDIVAYLKAAPDNFNSRNSEPFFEILATLKADAVKGKDQNKAKRIWCLEQVLTIQDQYITAFFQMKAEKYYEGWCTLEKVEINLNALLKHFVDENSEFYIKFIEHHTIQYQSLFPYKIFMSPEIIQIEKKCSTCGEVISLRESCGHRVGEIYDGEMCHRIVTKADFLSIAAVRNPVQKYSVMFFVDSPNGEKKDHYDYSVVSYLIRRLSSPFHAWDIEWSNRRQPHSRFVHVGRNDPCPCDSGKKYKKCCLPESGVLRPHCDFIFHVPPSSHFLNIEYAD